MVSRYLISFGDQSGSLPLRDTEPYNLDLRMNLCSLPLSGSRTAIHVGFVHACAAYEIP